MIDTKTLYYYTLFLYLELIINYYLWIFLAFQLNDYLIIWRGLFYFMWMSDKPLPQVNNILFVSIKHMYTLYIYPFNIRYFLFQNIYKLLFICFSKYFELVIQT